MTKNDIKKLLYKTSPTAKLKYIQNSIAYYESKVGHEKTTTFIRFEVPVNDMGDARFEPYIEGKLLIRWLVV